MINPSSLLKLIRPTQWIKNFVVFGPIIFGGALTNGYALLHGLIVFVAFSLAASSIYCFNDIIDVADDRRHPEKKHRPIASGKVTIKQAYTLMMVLFAASLATLLIPWMNARLPGADYFWCDPLGMLDAAGIVTFYWCLNLAYCMKIKQYAIIDVCTVAYGFVLRLMAGGVATGIVLSKWIVLMTFLLMLFMSFAKRRDDVIRMEATGEAPRKNTIHYNTTFINQAITITAAVTLVCYIMYTISPEVEERWNAPNLYQTSVFVLIGLLRYIQIAVVEKKSGNPTKVILKDRIIQLIGLVWLVVFLLIIYA